MAGMTDRMLRYFGLVGIGIGIAMVLAWILGHWPTR